MTVKSIDEEDELNNDNNLKNPAFTSKNSKGKPEFTKLAVLTQSSLYIQAQFINSTFTVEPSSSTPFQFKLSISFYQDNATLMLTLKHKNADMSQLESKHHITEAFKKDKVIQGLKIKFVEKQNELTVIKKKVEKAEQKIKHYSKH